jgi:hypothetical protein
MANVEQAHNPDRQPRPWLTRRHGECAFPSEGEGIDTRSCCQPCEAGTPYCAEHRKAMKGPRGPSVADMLREYARFLA